MQAELQREQTNVVVEQERAGAAAAAGAEAQRAALAALRADMLAGEQGRLAAGVAAITEAQRDLQRFCMVEWSDVQVAMGEAMKVGRSGPQQPAGVEALDTSRASEAARIRRHMGYCSAFVTTFLLWGRYHVPHVLHVSALFRL